MRTSTFHSIRNVILLLLVASCLACEQTPLLSPEKVVSRYIHHLHVGDFAAAQAHCTPAGKAYLNALQAIMTAVDEAPDSSGIRIETLRCNLPTDTTATCEAVLDDGFEQYTEQYVLRYRNGWLIHHEPATGATTTTTEETGDTED